MLTSSKEGERAGRTAAAGGGSGDCGRRGKYAKPDRTALTRARRVVQPGDVMMMTVMAGAESTGE